jgi:hypothetical protein
MTWKITWTTTAAWARSLGISTDPTPPIIDGYAEPCRFTARQIATRALVLQGVVAVAAGVDPEPVLEWFREQDLWEAISPRERAFLLDPGSVDESARNGLGWRQEAEWALLWVVGKVEALGLPTRQCDTRRLVDEIVPALGSDTEAFLSCAETRPPGLLLAEDDRHYDLWCAHARARRESERLPGDLQLAVLYQRRYAFEWLCGPEPWDDTPCDA